MIVMPAKIANYELAPEMVEAAILDAVAELRPSGEDTIETRRAALRAELRQVEAEPSPVRCRHRRRWQRHRLGGRH